VFRFVPVLTTVHVIITLACIDIFVRSKEDRRRQPKVMERARKVWIPEADLLRPEEMARVRDDDKAASASQRSENPWKTVDAKIDAMRKMTQLLS
jgi:hypothetical protein